MSRPVRRFLPVILLTAALLAVYSRAVRADEVCETYWDPIAQAFVTVCSGGGGTGGGGGSGGGGGGLGGSCTPGTIVVNTVVIGGSGLCEVWELWQDACTGQVVFSKLVDVIAGGSCTPAGPGPGAAANPCIVLSATAGGFYCKTDWGIDWLLEASVGFPSAFLDLRPYPVTLVRWPSAARNGGTPASAGSGSLDYIAYGGGDEDEPELGDWRDVALTLRLVPAVPVLFFSMPTIGTLALPDVGPNGAPAGLSFELPSHPEAGATVLAGDIGLSGVPADLPAFSGSAVSAYRLLWNLHYERWDRDCFPGPDPLTGGFHCRTGSQQTADDGHWEYDWDGHGMSGEITPQMVVGLPPGMAADLDGDGSPDAFWNRKVTVRRMDNANRIDNPQWSGSWSWGGAVYWAVREGQGQILWPLNQASFAGLALLCAGLAWFDWRTRRVPNPVTWLLLAAGFWRHFPGDPAVWLGCLLLAAGWQAGFIGGGDAKLWMALLWWVPAGHGPETLLVFGLSWLVSGGLQMAWRSLIGRPWLGVRSPAAWRAIPFVLWLWMLG